VGGTTHVEVCIDSESFTEIALAMMIADTERATKAFEFAMKEESRRQRPVGGIGADVRSDWGPHVNKWHV
jgi:hypothetical protein